MIDPLPMFAAGVVSVLTKCGYVVEGPLPAPGTDDASQPSIIFLTLTIPADWQQLDVLRAGWPLVPVVAVLEPVSVPAGLSALRAGASGLLPRSAKPGQVSRMVDALVEGQSVVPSDVLAALAGGAEEPQMREGGLTTSQLSWLRRLASGATVAELARDVGYSERAMYRLLGTLYRDMGVRGRMQAVVEAQRRGLLPE